MNSEEVRSLTAHDDGRSKQMVTEKESMRECPCEAVKELKSIVERHEQQLVKGSVQFAVINTKLNIVLGVMAAVGVALCGVIVKMIF